MPSANVLEQKKQIVLDLVETLKSSQAGVLVDYRGLTVEEDTNLRRKLREAGVEYKVVKNTLTRFAAKEVGLDGLDEPLNGPTSLAVSKDDPVAPAKVIAEFAKENECLKIKAGFLDGAVISLEEITCCRIQRGQRVFRTSPLRLPQPSRRAPSLSRGTAEQDGCNVLRFR